MDGRVRGSMLFDLVACAPSASTEAWTYDLTEDRLTAPG